MGELFKKSIPSARSGSKDHGHNFIIPLMKYYFILNEAGVLTKVIGELSSVLRIIKKLSDVSPKPIKQQLKLSAELKGCPERETLESSVRDVLRLHLPCARIEECAISNISCGITESGTVLFVTVASTALKNFTEQRLILEEASEFLQSNVLDMMIPSPHVSIESFLMTEIDQIS